MTIDEIKARLCEIKRCHDLGCGIEFGNADGSVVNGIDWLLSIVKAAVAWAESRADSRLPTYVVPIQILQGKGPGDD